MMYMLYTHYERSSGMKSEIFLLTIETMNGNSFSGKFVVCITFQFICVL